MKKFILLFFLILLSTEYPQTKYLIYFKDKGIDKTAALNKNSNLFKEALNSLSQRSIERRKKSMGDKYITYEDIPLRKDYISALINSGIKIENELKWFNAVSSFLTDEQKNKISTFPFIQKIERVKNLKFKRLGNSTANPPLRKNSSSNSLNYGPSFTQDNLIDIPQVHSKGITGDSVIIGILDSGFRWKTQESLMNKKVIAEYDFVFHDSITANQAGDIFEQDSHGTGVFSIMAGYKEGQIIGPAYNASFILAKTEDERSETHIEEDNYARALEWMDSIGVDITSSSLGYNIFDSTTYSYTYQDMNGSTTIVTKAAELAFQRGILTITAAGNEGNNNWHYIIAPADGFNTIAVGAVDSQNEVAGFSSRGPTSDGRIKPDVVAQGVNVYHADVSSSEFSYGDGTSYATPLTAGTAALLLSASPYLTNVQARDILLKTSASYQNPDNNRGYGLISAARAVSFPNIEVVSNGYKMHKIFINGISISPSTVLFNYKADSDTGKITPEYDGALKYAVSLPAHPAGTKMDFYFTYSDSSGNSYREPEAFDYSFTYGNFVTGIDSSEEIRQVPKNFILAQNYPNPFNNGTIIKFNSDLNVHARLAIYNILGEKIKVLFNGITNKKQNAVYWDGRTDPGNQSSSGIYFYTLIIDGKSYTKKMVYLK
jgi:subtilisin family serine protease